MPRRSSLNILPLVAAPSFLERIHPCAHETRSRNVQQLNHISLLVTQLCGARGIHSRFACFRVTCPVPSALLQSWYLLTAPHVSSVARNIASGRTHMLALAKLPEEHSMDDKSPCGSLCRGPGHFVSSYSMVAHWTQPTRSCLGSPKRSA